MTMKLFIDDVRQAPDDSWAVARTPAEAIFAIEESVLGTGEAITEISFDHDLGRSPAGDEWTTRPVLIRLIELDMQGLVETRPAITVHSANPVGREWLEGMASRYLPRE